jgi:RNA polymerase sigma factor (sigma-70 family)
MQKLTKEQQDLVGKWIPLVCKLANKYPQRFHEDLIQHGCLFLCRVVHLYKPEKSKFTTYIYRPLRGQIGLQARFLSGKMCVRSDGLESEEAIKRCEIVLKPIADVEPESDLYRPFSFLQFIAEMDGQVDNPWPDVDRKLDEKMVANKVDKAQKHLLPRQADFLRRRFGIGCEQQGIREISKTAGISFERVRQVQEQALIRLAQTKEIKDLECQLYE